MNRKAKYKDKNTFWIIELPFSQNIICKGKSVLSDLMAKLPNSYFTTVSFKICVLYFYN